MYKFSLSFFFLWTAMFVATIVNICLAEKKWALLIDLLKVKKTIFHIIVFMNSLKKCEGVLLLHFEGDPGVPLLNFEGVPGVPLLNFRGVLVPHLHHARRQWRCSGVFIVNFEHISNFFLVFLLLTLNM